MPQGNTSRRDIVKLHLPAFLGAEDTLRAWR
jgi:hypothetical protein